MQKDGLGWEGTGTSAERKAMSPGRRELWEDGCGMTSGVSGSDRQGLMCELHPKCVGEAVG